MFSGHRGPRHEFTNAVRRMTFGEFFGCLRQTSIWVDAAQLAVLDERGDQCLGGNASPCRCRGVHDRAPARTATTPTTARDEGAEGDWQNVETLGNAFADLMERAAAATTRLVLDINNPLDPLEMRRRRATFGLAWSVRPERQVATLRAARA